MKKLAIIPARGGSKRLKNKNRLLLSGKPLVVYTIESAIKSKLFDKIILSTDDEKIAKIGKDLGISIYYRPKKYASDTATVIQALVELMETFEKNGEKYDVVCQMLPTCPFRDFEDIKKGIQLLDKKTDSVISISTYNFPLPKSLSKKGDFIKPYWPNSPFLTGKTRTQDQQIFYHDNGAFYISWWESIKKYKTFYKGEIKGYEINHLKTIDIDNKLDFEMAEIILTHVKDNKNQSEIKKLLSHLI
ncbi:MAG: acylneuraminate cytidylyltransferase family protein [Patescibacteria group bacterium]|nr:acylneuraminate cytidylyltransferase family protein [Patescibacteria group bacterium]